MTLEGLNEDFHDRLVRFADAGVEFAVLTQISGFAFDEAWASRAQAELDGRIVNFIGRAALLENKEAAGRPQDMADGARLRRMKGTRGP
jgi:hypothetical protein